MSLSFDPSAPQIQCGKSPVRCCAACHQEWAETMMQRVDSRWLCALCKERALGDLLPKDQRRYQIRMGKPAFLWLKVTVGVALAASLGFRIWVASFATKRPAPRPPAEQLHLPADFHPGTPH
jgi:hypothetical protein